MYYCAATWNPNWNAEIRWAQSNWKAKSLLVLLWKLDLMAHISHIWIERNAHNQANRFFFLYFLFSWANHVNWFKDEERLLNTIPKMSDKEFLLIETSNPRISTEGLFKIAIVHLLFLNCLSLLFCRFYLSFVTGLESVSAGFASIRFLSSKKKMKERNWIQWREIEQLCSNRSPNQIGEKVKML